jgi:plasmid stabilization system protein ParE
MAEEKQIIYLPTAIDNIIAISLYIESKGYPMAAQKFKKKLFEFNNSFINYPEKYPLCRKPMLFTRKYRCAVFKKNYIFIYRPFKNKLVIYNVIHVSRYAF